jgi:hypothetical protein
MLVEDSAMSKEAAGEPYPEGRLNVRQIRAARDRKLDRPITDEALGRKFR